MYKVVIDSCGELTKELSADERFVNVPLELEVGGVRIVDDASFDQADFIRRVNECPTSPISSCPAPQSFLEQYECGAENVYAVTLSDKLSGSYNSAKVAADLYKEEHDDDKNIYVFDSKSASIGETLIGIKIKELEEAGYAFKEVVEKVEEYIASMHTYFVLETLETFRKSGRISNPKYFIANTLNIKPIMGSTDEGSIQQLGQSRGMKKALEKMVDIMLQTTKNTEQKILAISHCNCEDRAQYVKECIEKVAKFKDIIILNTAGVSTMYANDGGVIMAV